MQYFSTIAIPLAITLLSTPVLAAECNAKSSAHTVPLLELYTSEGCSSCPPADKWLSDLTPNPTQFIPLAFHVDYWDYIGWKDPFAKPAFTARQRQAAAFASANTVYTPQFMLNGHDFRGWNQQRLAKILANNQKIASPVALSVRLNSTQNAYAVELQADHLRPAASSKTQVFVAVYENSITSQINAGENSGQALKHDYVVRELLGGYDLDKQGKLSKRFTLNTAWKNRAGGVVVFAQNTTNGEILQSLALPFCGS